MPEGLLSELRDDRDTYEAAFQEAAMALAQVGDISDLVQTAYGYHIIQYVGDSVEGAVDIETVRESISSSLLTEKQNATYDAAVAEWTAAEKVKVYRDRIGLSK